MLRHCSTDGFTGIELITAAVPILRSFRNWFFLLIGLAIANRFWLKDAAWVDPALHASITDYGLWLVAIYVLLRSLLHILEVRFRGYKLDDVGLHVRSGYLTRIESIVPKDRLQRAEVNQDFIQRLFGFGDLSVFTAGSKLNSVTVQNIREHEMYRLRDEVIQYIGDRGD